MPEFLKIPILQVCVSSPIAPGFFLVKHPGVCKYDLVTQQRVLLMWPTKDRDEQIYFPLNNQEPLQYQDLILTSVLGHVSYSQRTNIHNTVVNKN